MQDFCRLDVHHVIQQCIKTKESIDSNNCCLNILFVLAFVVIFTRPANPGSPGLE